MLPRARPLPLPLLSPFFRPTNNPKRLFTTTAQHAAKEPTYYEILNVPITASTAEIKKQFYTLSLQHHPDRNREDPGSASRKFAQISSAYGVLGDNGKRAVYDRDTGISAQRAATESHPHHHRHHPTAGGSYSSYSSSSVYNKGGSYAGSRPASGLSKRRGPFRGPPPSFYAHGGFGGSGRSPGSHGSGGGGGGGGGGKEGEDDPTSFIDRNPVNHFNARGHFKTQSAEDIRRRERRSQAMGDAFREHQVRTSGDTALRFILVCGILVGTCFIPGMFWSGVKGGKHEPDLGLGADTAKSRKREG